MPNNNTQSLVSTQWLEAHINDDNLKLIDASWHMPSTQRNGYEEYSAAHIAGALFFDMDKVCDHTSDSPHMAPSVETFTAWLCAMGIDSSHQVVVYDGAGLFSAARVWWLFKLMGLNHVAVLDGGLPKWIAQGQSTTHITPKPQPCERLECALQPIKKTAAQVAEAVKSKAFQVVDARPPGRFLGNEPEPRPGLRSGHIPGSKNVFFKTLLQADNTMKSPDELAQVFLAAKVDITQPVITSCGSGVTAAIINLALTQTGQHQHSLYDGSWTEWGMNDALPIETGSA